MAAPDGLGALARTSPEPDGLAVAAAEGNWITDTAGRRYLDFLAGIGVCNTGHRHPRIVEAIRAQADRHLHVMVYGEWAQESQTRLADRLAARAPFPDARVYLANSGAEAVEGALKTARKATGRSGIIAFDRSYHGDTFGALSVLGVEAMRKPFGPLLPDVAFLPFGEPEPLRAIDERVAAVIVEPVQAEGGVRVPPDGFLPALRRRCAETGALLILDEVQTGLGRTGAFWAGEHWGVAPDFVVSAKALGGGLPLGAFMGPKRIMDTLADDPPLTHLTTFGGHPVSCAAGLAALDVTESLDLVREARELGEIALQCGRALAGAGALAAARGKGLLLGFELDSVARVRAVVAHARANGLLVGSALHDEKVLRLTPPLTIGHEDLIRGLDVLTASVTAAFRG